MSFPTFAFTKFLLSIHQLPIYKPLARFCQILYKLSKIQEREHWVPTRLISREAVAGKCQPSERTSAGGAEHRRIGSRPLSLYCTVLPHFSPPLCTVFTARSVRECTTLACPSVRLLALIFTYLCTEEPPK